MVLHSIIKNTLKKLYLCSNLLSTVWKQKTWTLSLQGVDKKAIAWVRNFLITVEWMANWLNPVPSYYTDLWSKAVCLTVTYTRDNLYLETFPLLTMFPNVCLFVHSDNVTSHSSTCKHAQSKSHVVQIYTISWQSQKCNCRTTLEWRSQSMFVHIWNCFFSISETIWDRYFTLGRLTLGKVSQLRRSSHDTTIQVLKWDDGIPLKAVSLILFGTFNFNLR